MLSAVSWRWYGWYWRGFKGPDLSHLAGSDKIAFTESLVEVLVSRGVWKPARVPASLARR